VLGYLRKGETFADLAAGFAVSTATAWRYVNEAVMLLSARALKLRAAKRARLRLAANASRSRAGCHACYHPEMGRN
jgi:hypothetical protein